MLFVTFTGAVEAGQLLAPGRHARLRDFMVDTMGNVHWLVGCDRANRFRSRPTGEVAGVLLLAVAAAHLDQLDRRASSVAILTFAAPAGK
jgi:hypothetical protein